MKTGATNISTGAGLLYRGPMVYKVSSGGALTLDGAAFGEGGTSISVFVGINVYLPP